MKNSISYLKQDTVELFALACIVVEEFVLFGNVILAVIVSLLSISLSLFLLVRRDKRRFEVQREISAYSFFDCFIQGLENSLGGKASYESASRYLVSYQQNVPYESLGENKLNLYSYQTYFDFIIHKDRENEVHLLSYRRLEEGLEKDIRRLKEQIRKEQRWMKTLFLLTILFLMVIVLFSAFQKMSLAYQSMIYLFLSVLTLGLLSPSICLVLDLFYKEKQHDLQKE